MLVLCVAAVAKLRLPHGAGTAVAAIELAVAGCAVIVSGAAAACIVAAAYLTFASVATVRVRDHRPCHCFGSDDRPPTRGHVALSVAFAGTGALSALWPPPVGITSVPEALAIASLTFAAVLVYTDTSIAAVGERAVTALGEELERRLSRRSVLARATLAGSAFAVAPLRYLVRPDPAWAVIRRPGSCAGGLCTDGYTAFCCEIEHGNNTCPPNTYVAGWWKCTSYQGHGLCHKEGVRYYIDCNRVPHKYFPGGCQCANGDCRKRRVDCNHFRYGQCNTQIAGTTEVVCRLIVCQNPAKAPGLNCNNTEMVDNNTCAHEAGCLQGLATQPPSGGGGA